MRLNLKSDAINCDTKASCHSNTLVNVNNFGYYSQGKVEKSRKT